MRCFRSENVFRPFWNVKKNIWKLFEDSFSGSLFLPLSLSLSFSLSLSLSLLCLCDVKGLVSFLNSVYFTMNSNNKSIFKLKKYGEKYVDNNWTWFFFIQLTMAPGKWLWADPRSPLTWARGWWASACASCSTRWWSGCWRGTWWPGMKRLNYCIDISLHVCTWCSDCKNGKNNSMASICSWFPNSFLKHATF